MLQFFDIMHHMIKPRGTLSSLFYFEVSPESIYTIQFLHLFCTSSFFFYPHSSALFYFQLPFIFSYFIHHISDLLYLAPNPFRLLSLIFVSIFISDFILHFHRYFICSIMSYIDITICSHILTLDSAFRLFISLCYITAQACTHLVSH